jgi:NAD(P)-dependent dehydrogenase (short-subunit alcohol dehydrogenase family)
MTDMLKGKNILITGAGSGVGRATAVLCAREGARVALSGRNGDALEESLALVEEVGGQGFTVIADVSSKSDVDALVHGVADKFGSLDGAFNNAGITGAQVGMGGKFTADWTEEAWNNIVFTNAKGVWNCMRAELEIMAAAGKGSIVNTASLAGLAGFITQSGYAASKHAVIGMTKTAALEYAPKVRVNVLCPGYVDTGMIQDAMSRRGEQILAKIPFGRLGTAEEMAEMVCWLLSDRASYATGGSFVIDGGYMAG